MKSFLTPQQIAECKKAANDLDPLLEDLFAHEPDEAPVTPISTEEVVFRKATPQEAQEVTAEIICDEIGIRPDQPSATAQMLTKIREREDLSVLDKSIDVISRQLAHHVLSKLFRRDAQDPPPIVKRPDDGLRLLLEAASDLGDNGPMVEFIRAFDVDDKKQMRAIAREIVRRG